MSKIPRRFHQWTAVELFIKTATFWAFGVSTVAQCDLIYWRTLDDAMLMSYFREWFVWDWAKKTKPIDVSTAGSQHRDCRPPLKLNRARAELLAPRVQRNLKYIHLAPQKRCCMTRRDCATETILFSWPECDTCDVFSRATIGRTVLWRRSNTKTPFHLPSPKLVQTNSDLW